MLAPLPSTFASTRESLRALACYVMSPAYKASTGRIGLRPTGDGFGTQPFDDGSRIVVQGDRLARHPGASTAITTLRAAAGFVGIDLSPDPGVGHDLPPFAPDAGLAVDAAASLTLGDWYTFGQKVLDRLGGSLTRGTSGPAQLWPEHFDLAVTVVFDTGAGANVGFSPGDSFEAGPYVYVGPSGAQHLRHAFWNAPFGAYLAYARLMASADPAQSALDFIGQGLDRLGPPGTQLDEPGQ